MSVLVLKLSGPYQSWGTGMKLRDHETDLVPSKSGVLGMIAAALGQRRDADPSVLASLRFGVRADAPGILLRDFHKAVIPSGEQKGDTYIGNYYYLEDACFTAALEGDRTLLEQYAEALQHPVFPPYLGRRCCIPDPGLVAGILEGTLESVLTGFPRQANGQGRMRICIETDGPGDRMRRDVPVSRNPYDRQFRYRGETEMWSDDVSTEESREAHTTWLSFTERSLSSPRVSSKIQTLRYPLFPHHPERRCGIPDSGLAADIQEGTLESILADSPRQTETEMWGDDILTGEKNNE